MKKITATLLCISVFILSGCFDQKTDNTIKTDNKTSENQKTVSYAIRTLETVNPYSNKKINQDPIILKNAESLFEDNCQKNSKCTQFKFEIDSPFVNFSKIKSISVIPVYEAKYEKYKNLDDIKDIKISSFVQFFTFYDKGEHNSDYIKKYSQYFVFTKTVFNDNSPPIYGLSYFDYRDREGFKINFDADQAILFADKDSITKIDHRTLIRFIKDSAEDAIDTRKKLEEDAKSKIEDKEFWKHSEVQSSKETITTHLS